MLAWIIAHSSLILMVLLTVSELLAVLVPSNGGILAAVINGLKALGARDAGSQPPAA